jgi:predicted PurR-regulated permease PerM
LLSEDGYDVAEQLAAPRSILLAQEPRSNPLKTRPPHPAHVDSPIERPAQVTFWRWAVALAAGLVLVYWLRFVLLPFVAAAALAVLTTPLVNRLHARWGGPRAIAAGVVCLTLLSLIGAAGYWIGTTLIQEAAELARAGPSAVRALAIQFLGGEQAEVWGTTLHADDLMQFLRNSAGRILETPQAIQLGLHGFEFAAGLVLAFVLLFYFLLDGSRLVSGAIWLVPPVHRSRAQRLAIRIHAMLFDYFRSVAVVVAAALLISWIGIGLLLRLPHAFSLATATGMLELIPVVGQLTAAVLLATVALLQGDVWSLAGVAIFLIVLRLTIDQVVGPLVLGRGLRLHPVVVLFSILSGAVLLGVLGLVVAVPAAATIKIALTELYEGGRLGES